VYGQFVERWIGLSVVEVEACHPCLRVMGSDL
jgi:hypothetical protein